MLLRLLSFFSIVVLCFLLPKFSGVIHWDEWVLQIFAAPRSKIWTQFFWIITMMGGTPGFLAALLLPVLLFLLQSRFITAIYFGLGVGLLKLSVTLWKIFVARPRPPEGWYWVESFSMPSGHAANAVLMFGILGAFLWPRLESFHGKILLATFCSSGIFLIGFSRVYLGVHYPSDVALGWLYTACGLWVLQGMRRDIFHLTQNQTKRSR